MCLLKQLLICCIIIILIVQAISEEGERHRRAIVRMDKQAENQVRSRKHHYEVSCVGGSRSASGFIPPVEKPHWKSPIPKFNALIVLLRGNKETPICSGALISYSFVVTVGTGCVLMRDNRPYSPDDLLIRLISYEWDHNQICTHEMKVKRLSVHMGRTRKSYLAQNDIVLIQLTKPVTYDDYMKAAKITKRKVLHHPAVHELWDLTNFKPLHLPVDFKDAVWFVKTRFVSMNTCKESAPEGHHNLKMTCASYDHVNMKNCSTDQGSPLSYKNELIGLLIWRQYSCGSPGSIALFVNIGVHSRWLREHVHKLSGGDEAI